MNDFIKNILNTIVCNFIKNGLDWLITALITFFSVKCATRQYYNKTKIIVSRNTMEQGLRALLKLDYNEELPDNAKVIFVEYKGRCWKVSKKNANEGKCAFSEKIRRTVAAVGGDTMGVSSYRPRDYGVLGIANKLEKPVLFNFQNGELYQYDYGKFVKLKTKKNDNTYIYISSNGEQKVISEANTARDIMIAVPIKYKDKLVGGVTFDMQVGAKTLYQNISESDTEEIKSQKEKNNNKVIKDVKRTADNLINAYFKKKGEDF